MAYQINKTDESILTVVPDGQIDENSTNLTLIGKNYSGFGEAFNENLVKLLENFADSRAPDKPIRGQIWFDVSESKVKVYNGLQFVPISSATISNARPESLGIGDLWYDNVNKQLFFFDGSETVLLAPLFSSSQGLSGLQVRSILDSLNQTRVITLLYNNGVLLGIFSKDAFVPRIAIDGFSGNIEPGFNAGSLSGIKFRVTVTNSEQLGGASALTYVRRDTANNIDGQIRITTDLGLSIGSAGQGNFIVNDGNLIIANAAAGRSTSISVRRGITQETAFSISSDNRTIDLYPEQQDSIVTTGGSLIIGGNLTVQGTTTTINTANVVVEDKAIELAVIPGGAPSNVTADEGGIILQGSIPKVIIWSNEGNASYPFVGGGLRSQAWNFSEHINLGSGKFLYLNSRQIFRSAGSGKFALTDEVIAIDGVTSFGPQIVLDIGPDGETTPPDPVANVEMRLINNKISTVKNNLDLELAPNGTGNVSLIGSPRITGLADPVSGEAGEQDAATREYVDRQIQSNTIVLSIDLSDGKSNTYIITNILNNLCPPADFRDGTRVRMLCSLTSNSSTSVDLNSLITLSTSIFNTPGGTASAVTNVALANATLPGASISITRIVKIFQLVGGSWVFVVPTQNQNNDILLPP